MFGVSSTGTAAVGAGAAAATAFWTGALWSSSGGIEHKNGPDLSPIAGIEDVTSATQGKDFCSQVASGSTCNEGYEYDPLDHVHMMGTLLVSLLAAVLCWVFYPAFVARKSGDFFVVEETLTPGIPTSRQKRSVTNTAESVPLLSIVIPAYNEKYRLPIMLDSALLYLSKYRNKIFAQVFEALGEWYSDNNEMEFLMRRISKSVEIIIVSDGSTDDTESVVRSYADAVARADSKNCLRLITLSRNSGKGAAVQVGMARSRGMFCLMVDADGATEFGSGLSKVLTEMKMLFSRVKQTNAGSASVCKEPVCAVFGSRAHLEDEPTAERSKTRVFLMHAFHFFVKCLCSANIRDTQCGFKLFSKKAASIVSNSMHLRRWAFDTEIVVMMERNRWPIVEVAVDWHEVEGSKIDESKLALALNSIGMLRDMLCVRAAYTLRVWRIYIPNDPST